LILIGFVKNDKEKLTPKITLKVTVAAVLYLIIIIIYWKYLAQKKII